MLHNCGEDFLKLFEKANVLLKTEKTRKHYLLSNVDEHTDKLFQCSIGSADAEFRARTTGAIVDELAFLGIDRDIDLIITPALGSILFAGTLQERFLGKKPKLFYAEKMAGNFVLRHGFELKKEQRILIFDDVYSTGRTMEKIRDMCHLAERSVAIVAQAALVNRNPDGLPLPKNTITVPHVFLLEYPIRPFPAKSCPYCVGENRLPLEKDGTIVDIFGNPIESGQTVDEGPITIK